MTGPPPGPFRPGFFRSPLRGPRLTAILGLTLLVLVTIVAVTGFLSHAAYQPDLGNNGLVEPDLPLTFFDWPTGPSWLYALNQGLHVNVGLVAVPWLLAKLWSVMPRLFAWPPVTSAAQATERARSPCSSRARSSCSPPASRTSSTGTSSTSTSCKAHYYAAVVFVAALGVHLVVKLPGRAARRCAARAARLAAWPPSRPTRRC